MANGLGSDAKPAGHQSGPGDLVRASTILYAIMGFVGFEICYWSHQSVPTIFHWSLQLTPRWLMIIFIASAFMTVGQLFLEISFESYRNLKWRLSHVFRGSRWFHAVYLACISAIGEEFLFRAGLQPWLGVPLTSAAFALLHLDPERGLSLWSLWAFLGGLILGEAFQSTGSIWVPIIIHALVNSIAIGRLSRFYNRVVAGNPNPTAVPR